MIFDFDGPVCRLFAQHPVGYLTRRMHELFDGFDGLSSPHEILRLAALGGADAAAVARAERFVDEAEVAAAATAEPTPFADDLVELLVRRGPRLAVASNNSARSVRAYLERRGLAGHFGDRIFGRAPDPALMKPDPDSLVRCLAALGADPRECVFIGDSSYDVQAAHKAGVPFLGYGRDEAKTETLRAYGADVVIRSMGEITEAVSLHHA